MQLLSKSIGELKAQLEEEVKRNIFKMHTFFLFTRVVTEINGLQKLSHKNS